MNISSLSPVTTGITPLSADQVAAARQQTLQNLEQRYIQPTNAAARQASQQPYATIQVNGQTVATVDNSGTVRIPRAEDDAKLTNLPQLQTESQSGPNFAQQRADYIAKTLGGTVVKSSSAITQQQYDALPPLQKQLNTSAMMSDPLYKNLFGDQTLAALTASQEV